MVTIRLFAGAREAAGTDRDTLDLGGFGDGVGGDGRGRLTVGAVLDEAVDRFGADFAAVLATCKVWVNGEPANRDDGVSDGDEVAVLPPVSGGA